MVEEVLEGHGRIARLAHQHVVGIACYERVAHREVDERRLRGCELQGRSSPCVEGVELCEGALVEGGVAAIDAQAALERVGYLAVEKRELGVDGVEAIALAVVDGGMVEGELWELHIRRVGHDAMVGAMDIGERQVVVVARRIEPDALPLPRHAVVGKVIEHAVDAVAAQHHLAPLLAEGLEGAADAHARVVVEIEGGARRYGERGSAVDLHASVDDEGFLLGADERVAGDVYVR